MMKLRFDNLILPMLAGMIVLCIVGAFLGAEKVCVLFDAIPFAVRQLGWLIVLAWSFFALRQIFVRPAIFIIHLGCIFVLSAGILGNVSHRLSLHMVFSGSILLIIGVFAQFYRNIKSVPNGK